MPNEYSASIIDQTITGPESVMMRTLDRPRGPALSYRLQYADDAMVIYMKGRLTFAERSDFRDLLLEDSIGCDHLVLDMRDLLFLDSSGLGMLLIANDQLTKKGMKLSIRGAHSQVAHVLRISQLSKIFPIELPHSHEVTNDS